MSFQPIVPLTGYTGWIFLQRTMGQQQEAFQESQPVVRATDYFRENIGKINTAEELVNDRQLLDVALGAFGLSGDINNKFFVQKILEGGTLEDDALANRLADNRYASFARAFGFGDFGLPLTKTSVVVDDIISRFESKRFEEAVGEQNNDLRLSLNLASGIEDVTGQVESQDARWFALMGNQPLRQVVQTALGLPSQIASVDLDLQLTTFKDRAQSVFGTDEVGDFADPEVQEKLIRLFLVRSEAAASSAFSSNNIALSLLRSA